MSWAVITGFLKKYWKQTIFALLCIAVMTYIFVLRRTLYRLTDKVEKMRTEIAVKDESIRSQEKIIDIQQTSMKIFENLVQKESQAETIHTERVVENKEIIREFVESEKEPKDLQKIYDRENKLWREMYSVLSWWESK